MPTSGALKDDAAAVSTVHSQINPRYIFHTVSLPPATLHRIRLYSSTAPPYVLRAFTSRHGSSKSETNKSVLLQTSDLRAGVFYTDNLVRIDSLFRTGFKSLL